jgi:proline racemase
MRAQKVFAAVDSHTEGMPTRVVTAGIGVLPGATMFDRMRYLVTERDDLRTLLMYEPRGHAAMSGAILQPPTRPEADAGVVFIEVSGCLPMCGHGTIGTATVLVETGMVEIKEPVTRIRLDTPAGLVETRVEVSGGRALSVTIQNVASYLHLRDARIQVAGLGELTVDVAFGGNFYAIVPAVSAGLEVRPELHDRIVETGMRVLDAVNDQLEFAHPDNAEISGCRHVMFTAPGDDEFTARATVAIHPGWVDRSPCGTGTSARMAQLAARGQLGLHEEFVHGSLIGTKFTGRLVDSTRVGDFEAVVPTVRGRAWVTAMGHYLLDPSDPFPAGFLIGKRA